MKLCDLSGNGKILHSRNAYSCRNMMNKEETIKTTVYRLKTPLYFKEDLLFQNEYVHSKIFNVRDNNDLHLSLSS